MPARLRSGRRIYVDLRSGIGRGIYATGEFDPVVFEPIRTALRPGGTFVDVGANVGFYSMLALDIVGASGAVHAFEIDPRPLRCLRKTIARERLTNLVLHEVAVGRTNGGTRLVAREDSGHSGVAEDGRGPALAMVTLDRWWRQTRIENVQAIKIDIEGGECAAVEGAQELIREMRPVVVCEADDDLQRRSGGRVGDLMDLLTALGYRTSALPGAWSPTVVARPL